MNPIFLAKQMAHDRIQRHFAKEANGITRYGLTTAGIHNTPVWLPPRRVQDHFAATMRSLDKGIHKTEQVIAKLKQMKQGLLHDLLTRGIDENGELRDPERHPEQFKDSPLGRIPREWAVSVIGDLSDVITSGSRGWAAYYAETGPKFIRIGNLTREHINLRLANFVHVQPPAQNEGRRTSVEAGDVLISITADLGIIGVTPSDLGEAYVNQHIALVRLKKGSANPRWVGHYLSGPASRRQFELLDDAGAKAGLNLPTVGRVWVALPSSREQDYLVFVLDGHDRSIVRERLYLEKLRTLKKGLMDDLLTGRVRVNVDASKAA